MKTHLITGAAGFVGVNLIRRLLARGDKVIGVDDLSRGHRAAVVEFEPTNRFTFQVVDCSRADLFVAAVRREGTTIDDVWHLAANSDIPAGIADHRIDLHRTFLTTVGTLEVMQQLGIKRLHFASSSAIYGDHGDLLIHENIGPLQPISNYGAMKLASEVHIRAAVEAWLPRADILRFPNVIGVPATHGVMLDFFRKLRATPDRLDVLGNGTQQKAYLHVDDLVSAMLHIAELDGRYLVYNVGPTDSGITVRAIAEAVRDMAAPKANIAFGEGDRGWVGDVPRFRYSVQKLLDTGWKPRHGSSEAMQLAVAEIGEQEMPA